MEKLSQVSLESRERTLAEIYSDDSYITLYRYEKPETEYNENREGSVSKREIVGQWFTKNIDDLKTYIKARKPRGVITTVRIPKESLEEYDATVREDTKDMDIEVGNFIIPPEVQRQSRIEIPLAVESRLNNKFSFSEFGKINDFVDRELSPRALLSLAARM